MFISQREIAKRLGVALATVNKWVKQGYLPSVRIGGITRVPREQFEEWYQALREEWSEGAKKAIRKIM